MTVYVFDTNSFRILSNYYPRVFPTFWNQFEEGVEARDVVSVREVYNELERQISHTWLWDWVRQRREQLFLIPGREETEVVTEIFKNRHFRTIVGEAQRLEGWPVADPFVVAAARVRDGCVVTEESSRPNAARIPNVCDYLGVECINVEGFLDRNGWQF